MLVVPLDVVAAAVVVGPGTIGASVRQAVVVVEGKLEDILEVMLRRPVAEKKTALWMVSGVFEELDVPSIVSWTADTSPGALLPT